MSEHIADDPGPVDVVRLREPESICPDCARLTAFWGKPKQCGYHVPSPEAEILARLEAKLDALETLVREIKHALSAGAVGKWA